MEPDLERSSFDIEPDRSATIAIICYNYARFLPEAIESALRQDELGLDIIVIDDGSTDGTRSVAQLYGDRISYHYQPNSGLSSARNLAASLCRTRYIMYLDADNILPSVHLRICLDAIQKEPGASFVYTQLDFFGDSDGRSNFPSFSVGRLMRGNYIDSSALIPAAAVRRIRYDPRLRWGLEDWDFNLGLVEQGFHGVLCNESAVSYRIHEQQMGTAVQRRAFYRRWTYLVIFVKHHRLLGVRAAIGMAQRFLRYRLG